MNLTGVACVKNEADIIEAFVRHNLFYLNRLIILDHGSTDDTARILRALQNEGLNLETIHDVRLGKLQGEKMTLLMRRAAEEGADWVFLLDGDEFLSPKTGELLSMPSSEKGKGILKIPWITYCAHMEDDPTELNPVLRMRHRLSFKPAEMEDLKARGGFVKAVVRRDIALHPEASVMQGNHKVLVCGVEPSFTLLDSIDLGHYSLRSPGQYSSKIAIGVLQHLSIGSMAAPIDSFYVSHLEEIRRNFDSFSGQFHDYIPSYLEMVGYPSDKIADPLPYRGAPLKYSLQISDSTRLTSNLLAYSEILARAIGQYPPELNVPQRVESSLTLRPLSNPDRIIDTSSVMLAAVDAETVTLSMAGWDGKDHLLLEITGPTGYVECTSFILRREDGSSHQINGLPLRNLLQIRSKAHYVHHDHYLCFIKSIRPAELSLDMLQAGLPGPWKELEITVRFDTNPAVMGLRYFQNDPFVGERHLLNKIGHMEFKLSMIAHPVGFLLHQIGWLWSLIRN